MHILYIYNSEKDRPCEVAKGDTAALYCMNFGVLTGGRVEQVNDSQRLNEIARESAEGFSEFIYKQNERFINGELVLENRLSLYFITDLACKRTEQFATFSDYCNARLIGEYLKQRRVDKIVLDGCRGQFVQAVKSVSGESLCVVENEVVAPGRVALVLIKNALFSLKVMVGAVARRVLIGKGRGAGEEINRLFLTRYPLHLDAKLNEDKYGELVGEDGTYLVNLFTDNFHQRVGVRRYLQATRILVESDRVEILDDYLKPLDALKSISFSLSLAKKVRLLYHEPQVLDGIELTANINDELFFTLSRVPRLLMWENAVKRFVGSHRVATIYYYLHEYGYGRLFTYLFRRYSPETHLVGFQHGPASERKMVYMAAKGELTLEGNAISSFPVPDEILAEDEHSAAIYRGAGYVGVSVMDKIYRLSYLQGIERSEPDPNMVLIAPGLHDGKFLLSSIAGSIAENQEKRFVLNPHPRADNGYIEEFLNMENLHLADCPLTALLSKVSKVIATYSSVAIEARLLGIEVELVEIPGRINESPLLDVGFEKIVAQARDNIEGSDAGDGLIAA